MILTLIALLAPLSDLLALNSSTTLSFLNQTGYVYQDFLDDGWVISPNDTQAKTLTARGITWFGPFSISLYKEFPPYKITVPVSFAQITFRLMPNVDRRKTVLGPTVTSQIDQGSGGVKYNPAEEQGYYVANLDEYQTVLFDPFHQNLVNIKIAFGYSTFVGGYNITFYNCTSSCKKCDWLDPLNCTACYDNSELNSKTCQCRTGFYWSETVPCESEDPSDCFKCVACNPACVECWGPGSSHCSLCPFPLFLEDGSCVSNCSEGKKINAQDQSNKTCIDSCPSDSFKLLSRNMCLDNCEKSPFPSLFNDYSAMDCGTCDPNCLNCSFSSKNCTVCPNKTKNLYKGECLSQCPASTYQVSDLDSGHFRCIDCEPACENCDGNPGFCSKCKGGYFLLAELMICSSTCLLGYYGDSMKRLCMPCADNCLICESQDKCDVCKKGWSENGGKCKKIKEEVPANLTKTNDPFKFLLALNYTNCTFSGNLSQEISVSFTNTSLNFPHQIQLIDPVNCQIAIEFSVPDTTKSALASSNKLETEPFWLTFDDSNENFYIIPNSFTQAFNLSDYQTSLIYSKDNFSPRKLIDFRLYYRKSSEMPILLEFFLPNESNRILRFSEFPLFYDLLPLNSSITIQSLSESSFSYALASNPSQNLLEISLNFSSSVLSAPSLFFSIFPDFGFFNVSLLKRTASIPLGDFLVISESMRLAINVSREVLAKGGQVVESISSVCFLLNFANMVSIRNLIMFDLLKFYRYVNIKYPLNMLELFLTNWDLQSLTILDFPIDPRDPEPQAKFKVYGISSYFLNNANISLFQLAGTYLLGLFVLFLGHKYRFFKEAMELNWWEMRGRKLTWALFGKGCINLASRLIIWNFIVSQFLAAFNENSLYIFVTFTWPPLNSSLGKANFAFAVLFFAIMIFFLFLIYKKIRKIRQILLRNVVLPFDTRERPVSVPNPQIPPELTANEPKKPSNGLDFSDFFDLSPNTLSRRPVLLGRLGYQVIPWERLKHLLDPPEIQGFAERDSRTVSSPHEKPRKFELPLKMLRNIEVSIDETTARTRKSNINAVQPSEDLEIEENIMKSRYRVLFRQVDRDSRLQSYFILVELARELMFAGALPLGCSHPLTVSVFLESLNFIMLFVVMVWKPYGETKDWIMAILGDLGLNIAGMVCVVLAFMDKNADWDPEKRMNLGWVFCLTNCALVIMMICVFTGQILGFAVKVWRFIARFYRNRKRGNYPKVATEIIEKSIKNKEDSGEKAPSKEYSAENSVEFIGKKERFPNKSKDENSGKKGRPRLKDTSKTSRPSSPKPANAKGNLSLQTQDFIDMTLEIEQFRDVSPKKREANPGFCKTRGGSRSPKIFCEPTANTVRKSLKS